MAKPTTVLLSVIAGPEAWDPETGHWRLMSRWFRWWLTWIQTYDPEKVTLTLDVQREVQVAHARTLAIRRARLEHPDQAWQIDTDVQLEQPVHEVARLVGDCRDRGFSLVTSPGMSSEAVIEISFPPGELPRHFEPVPGVEKRYTLTESEPFPITKGWGGFIAFTKAGYSRLPVAGVSKTISGVEMEQYCFSAPDHPCPHCGKTIEGMGEDVYLYHGIRSAGMKCCADPRIGSTHLKVAGLKSLRKGMSVGVPDENIRAGLAGSGAPKK